jgi:hypothetical protein
MVFILGWRDLTFPRIRKESRTSLHPLHGESPGGVQDNDARKNEPVAWSKIGHRVIHRLCWHNFVRVDSYGCEG